MYPTPAFRPTSAARHCGLYQQVHLDSQVHGDASPHQMVTMLFDGLFESLAQARGALRANDIAAKKAQATALAKDKQAFFEAGSEIYEACVACHNHYVQGDAPGVDAKLPELPNRTPPPQNQ